MEVEVKRTVYLFSFLLLFSASSAKAISMEDIQRFWSNIAPAVDMASCINKHGQYKCLQIECIKIDYQHPSCAQFSTGQNSNYFGGGSGGYGGSCCDISGFPRCTLLQPAPLGSNCFCPGQGTGFTC